MQKRFPQILLGLFFLGLLATPLVMERLSVQSRPAVEVDAGVALSRYGFYLEEVAEEAGLAFTHEAPTFDPQLDHIMPQIAAMGASVSAVDFDQDGWQDLYVTNSGEGSRNALFRNLGDGSFRDVAPELGVADVNREGTGVSMGTVWGDYDNDGYPDLFLYKYGRPELFHNDGGRGFTRVTEGAGLPAWVNANTALWFDYDRDGRLDLFLSSYFHEALDLWHLETTRIMPESFEYAKNGGRKYLLRNEGDGRFRDVTEELGITSRRWTLAAGAADVRGTGYPDLFLANDYGVAEVYLNEEGKGFVEAGEATGIGFAPKSGMNVSFGDVLNQGEFAVYVSNISEEGVLIQGNNLWVPRGRTKDGVPTYENMARAMGVELGGWSYGAQFGDLNNDGHVDLYLVNGYVSADRQSDYWYDYSKIAGGNRAIIGDAKNWPPMEGRSLSGYQRKRVWMNGGGGTFVEVGQAVGATDLYDGRSVVLVDLWNRGVLDVIVANQRGPLLLYRNTPNPENAWIAFDLQGTASNRDAIGAQVELYWSGRRQLQQVFGGIAFSAQNGSRLHFGLGRDPQLEKAVIRWPSGKTQTIEELEINRLHTIVEPGPPVATAR